MRALRAFYMSVEFKYSVLSPVWSINVPTVLRNHLMERDYVMQRVSRAVLFFPATNNVAMTGKTCIIQHFHSYKPADSSCYVMLLLLKQGKRQRLFKLRCEDGDTVDSINSCLYAERLNELLPIVSELLRDTHSKFTKVNVAACCFYGRRIRIRQICKMRYFWKYYIPPYPI